MQKRVYPRKRRSKRNIERLEARNLLTVDLGVQLTSNRDQPIPLEPATYEIKVSNAGPDDAIDARIDSNTSMSSAIEFGGAPLLSI